MQGLTAHCTTVQQLLGVMGGSNFRAGVFVRLPHGVPKTLSVFAPGL
jgi:hypothetical protein